MTVVLRSSLTGGRTRVDAELGIDVRRERRAGAIVQRLDVARDIAVPNGRAVLAALTPLHRPRATNLQNYFDPKELVLTGLVVGNRTSHVKGYVRDRPHP